MTLRLLLVVGMWLGLACLAVIVVRYCQQESRGE